MTSLQEQLAALHTDTAAASTSAEATTATKLRTLMASIAGVTTEDIADNFAPFARFRFCWGSNPLILLN